MQWSNYARAKVLLSEAIIYCGITPNFNQNWVPALSPQQLSIASDKRVESVVAKYKGEIFHWDVINENLHFNFFESKLGPNASTHFFRLASQFDNTTLFLNDFFTIEKTYEISAPANYIKKIKQLRKEGYGGPLGIGLQGHFSLPIPPYIRSALDMLASAKLPIWITELDVTNTTNQVLNSLI